MGIRDRERSVTRDYEIRLAFLLGSGGVVVFFYLSFLKFSEGCFFRFGMLSFLVGFMWVLVLGVSSG